MLATVAPGAKLTFDAKGWGVPQGNTVTNPAATGWVTVTVSTTVEALPATPPRPVTVSSVIEPPARTPNPANNPSVVASPGPTRVSSNRAGINDTNGDSAGKKPLTSTTRSVLTLVNRHTRPAVPTPEKTVLATVAPRAKLTLDASGCGVPQGNTVRNPAAIGWVTVTVSTTA